jgi:hypothetical protein
LDRALRVVRDEAAMPTATFNREVVRTMYDRAKAVYNLIPEDTRRTLWLVTSVRRAA